jgi:hypothetical protein
LKIATVTTLKHVQLKFSNIISFSHEPPLRS